MFAEEFLLNRKEDLIYLGKTRREEGRVDTIIPKGIVGCGLKKDGRRL